MKMLSFRFIVLSLITLTGGSWSPARGTDLPAWVVAEKQTLPLKKSALPNFVELTQSATVIRPKALTDAGDLEKLNPGLLKALPGLRDLVGKATVSPRFTKLYDEKIASMTGGEFMTENEYFDCATVLTLKDAKSGRSVLLLQANMDTDTDGTDPARLPALTDYDDARESPTFQPLLSYSWDKSVGDLGQASNPFLQYYSDTLGRLAVIKKQVDEFAKIDKGPIWQRMKPQFDEQIAALTKRAKYYHDDLVNRRSLVASLDPFIVIPMNWADKAVAVGDFVAVVYAGQVYPCVIGDAGPDEKVGEASQFLARALNPKASGKVSAVDSPNVTYLIFPGTRKEPGEPKLETYHAEVNRLLSEIGGLAEGLKLHEWK